MKKTIYTIFLLFLVLSGYSQNRNFIEKLKKEFTELNKTLPKELYEGMWVWSISYSNKEVTIIAKTKSLYASIAKGVINKMIDEDSKAFVKLLGKEAPLFASNGISFRLQYQSLEDNHVYAEIKITPDKILRYYNELKSTKKYDNGVRPLSYYQQGFTLENQNLPLCIDEHITLYKISMPYNILYYDYYIDDVLAKKIVSDATGELKRSLKDDVTAPFRYLEISKEMKSDFKTYKIQIYYRYFFISNKKLAFQIIVNPITYF